MMTETTLNEAKAEFAELKKIPYVDLIGPQRARYKVLKNQLSGVIPARITDSMEPADTQPAEPKKAVEKVPSYNKDETPQEKIERTKRDLENGPMMTIAIPLGQGEKAGAKDSVTINGYRVEFTKGVQFTIPTPMAELVMAHYNIGLSNGLADEFRLSGGSKGKNLGDTSSN